ncbi:MAG: adenylate kinase [Bacteroidota bacterium]|nr:adenylate kinase [Bacteroidota bacterium]MDP4233143.1 adenylate kinase [Bacteroidota bacterium]MDP4241712.1 adenylate kinase [Bacteroidota bacterium]MDP4287370.1 adenylate kinase [Bacteroidota bacterium]
MLARMDDYDTLQKVCVIGSSASGKTTFARALAARIGCEHIELDALYHDPNWTAVPWDVFRERAQARLASERWVCDGYYDNQAGHFDRADLIVWLDYPFRIVLSRVLRRTVRRVFIHEELWNGNRETLRKTFSRESIVVWVFQTYWKRRRQIPMRLSLCGTPVVRFRHPREASAWMRQIKSPSN